MGLQFQNIRMLCQARRQGASFERVVTAGHLSLYLHPAELESLLTEFPEVNRQAKAKYAFGAYSDEFFRDFLGTEVLTVLDISDFEGADLIHDLNQPISSRFHGRFDAVVDGGSLEHVFNFPVAVANLMQMAKVGGRVFASSPANNLCGHGFYQFSPELMYRVFCSENGFEMQQILMFQAEFPSVELTRVRKIFRVADPKAVGSRIMLTSGRPAMLLIDALKTSDLVPFAQSPQQSDYFVAWGQPDKKDTRRETLRLLQERLPRALSNRLHGHYQRWKHSMANRRFFQRLRD